MVCLKKLQYARFEVFMAVIFQVVFWIVMSLQGVLISLRCRQTTVTTWLEATQIICAP